MFTGLGGKNTFFTSKDLSSCLVTVKLLDGKFNEFKLKNRFSKTNQANGDYDDDDDDNGNIQNQYPRQLWSAEVYRGRGKMGQLDQG